VYEFLHRNGFKTAEIGTKTCLGHMSQIYQVYGTHQSTGYEEDFQRIKGDVVGKH